MPKKKKANRKSDSSITDKQRKNRMAVAASTEVDFFWSSFFDDDTGELPDDLYCRDVVGKTLWQTIALIKDDSIISETAIARIHQVVESAKSDHIYHINQRNESGLTPLGEAICAGNLQATMVLITLECVLEESVPDGLWLHAVLRHLAGKDDHLDFARSLIDHPPLINQPDSFGDTPLHIAINGQKSPLLALTLLLNGADPNKSYENGELLLREAIDLHRAAESNQAQQRGKKSSETVQHTDGTIGLLRELLEKLSPEHIETYGSDNRTALTYAAVVGSSNLVRLILECHPNCDVLDNNQRNIMHHLAMVPDELYSTAHRDTVLLVDEAGVDFFAQDSDGNTPVMLACIQKNSHIARLILGNSMGQIHLKNHNHEHMLFLAIQSGNNALCELVLNIERSLSQVPYSLLQTDCPISPHCHALIKQHYSREIQQSKCMSPILLCILLWKIQPQSSNLLLMLLRACFTTGYPAEDLYHHALYSGALDAIPILSRFGINIQERHLNHLERIGKPSQTPLNVYFSAIRQINSELIDTKEASVMTHLHQVPLDIFPVTWVKSRPDLFGEVYTLLCLETNNFMAKNSHFWSCVSLSRMSRFHHLDDQNSDFSLLYQRSVRAILLQCEQSKIIKRCPPEKRKYFDSLGISFDSPSPEQMHQLTQNANYESEMQRIIPARDLVFITDPMPSTLTNGQHDVDQSPQAYSVAYVTALSFWQDVLEILYRETTGEPVPKNTPILTLLVDIIDVHISRLLVENIHDSNGFFNALRVLNQCNDEAIRQVTLDEFHKLFQHSGSNDGLGIFQGLVRKIRHHTAHRPAIVYTSAADKIPLEGLFDIACAYHQHLHDIQSDKAPGFYAEFLNYLLQPGQILSDPSYVKSWLCMDLGTSAWIRHADNQLRILLYCARLTGLSESTEQCAAIFKLVLTVLQPEIIKSCAIHPMIIRYLTEFDRLQIIRVHSTALYLTLHSYVQHHVIMSVRSYRSNRHTTIALQSSEDNRISQLQHEITELNMTVESSDQMGRDLQQRIDGMSASHLGLKKEIKQLTAEKRQLSNEVETLRKKLDEYNEMASKTRHISTEKDEEHIQKIREHEKVINDLQERLTSSESRSDQQHILIKKHEQDIATHEQQYQRDTDILLRKHRQINTALQQEQQSLTQANQQLHDIHGQDQDRIRALESTLDLERKAYQTASESTQSVIKNAQQENDELRRRIQDLEVHKRQVGVEKSAHESTLRQNNELRQQLKVHETAQEKLLARIRGEDGIIVNDALSARWIREVMAEIHRSYELSTRTNGHSRGKKLSRKKQTTNGDYISVTGRQGFFHDASNVYLSTHRMITQATYSELFDGMQQILTVLSDLELIRSIHLGGSIALSIARNTSPEMLSILLHQMEEDIDLTLHVDHHSVNGQTLFPSILKLLPGYTMQAKHSINKCLIVSPDTSFRFDLSIRKQNEISNHPDSISWLWSPAESGWIIDLDRLSITQQQFLLGTWNASLSAADNYSLFWAIHQQIKHYSFGFSSSATFSLLTAAIETTPSRERVGSAILEILKKFVGTTHWPSAIALVLHPFEYGSKPCSIVHYLLPPSACFPRNHQLSAYDTRHLMTVIDLLIFIKTYWMQFEIDTEHLHSAEGVIDWSQISIPIPSSTTISSTKI